MVEVLICMVVSAQNHQNCTFENSSIFFWPLRAELCTCDTMVQGLSEPLEVRAICDVVAVIATVRLYFVFFVGVVAQSRRWLAQGGCCSLHVVAYADSCLLVFAFCFWPTPIVMVPTCQHAEAALHGRSRTAHYYLLDGMFVGGEFCRPGKELLRVSVELQPWPTR